MELVNSDRQTLLISGRANFIFPARAIAFSRSNFPIRKVWVSEFSLLASLFLFAFHRDKVYVTWIKSGNKYYSYRSHFVTLLTRIDFSRARASALPPHPLALSLSHSLSLSLPLVFPFKGYVDKLRYSNLIEKYRRVEMKKLSGVRALLNIDWDAFILSDYWIWTNQDAYW